MVVADAFSPPIYEVEAGGSFRAPVQFSIQSEIQDSRRNWVSKQSKNFCMFLSLSTGLQLI